MDARTDIFAFGTVILEMVTGRKAFEGTSQVSLISSIMTADPPALASLQSMSPPVLDQIVSTCLAKSPDARWQSIGDVGRQLNWAETAGSIRDRSERGFASSGGQPHRLVQRPVAFAAAFGTVVVAAGIFWWASQPTPVPLLEQTQFDIAPPLGDRILTDGIALSPDGRTLVYVGRRGGVPR